MLKEAKNQYKGYKYYRYNDAQEQVPQIKDRVRKIQVTPTVGLLTPVPSQTGYVDQQNTHFNNEPP